MSGIMRLSVLVAAIGWYCLIRMLLSNVLPIHADPFLFWLLWAIAFPASILSAAIVLGISCAIMWVVDGFQKPNKPKGYYQSAESKSSDHPGDTTALMVGTIAMNQSGMDAPAISSAHSAVDCGASSSADCGSSSTF